MKDVNSVVLVGRLTRDPELKYTGGGTAILNFSIAVNRSVKKGEGWEDEGNFFDVSLFGKQAEAVSKYMGKGKQVSIAGELKQDRWEKDGQKRSRVKIHAHTLQLLGGKSDNIGTNGQDPMSSDGPENFEDDIPF